MLLLIDADIPCYRAAAACETEVDWGDDVWSIYTDVGRAKELFQGYIQKFVDDTGCDELKLCYTSSDNFRSTVYPPYKGNRKSRKPVGYGALKEWSKELYPHFEKPTLEADDCMGILATKFKGKTMIVTMDKDLKTIPGTLWHLDQKLNGKKIQVTDKDAWEWFLTQTLTGDVTDGFPGCPGIGPVSAKKLLETKGANWDTVKHAYIKAGLTEDDALVQARCARILHASDWDFEKSEVILWKPQ
jgi:DNA polymerase-1